MSYFEQQLVDKITCTIRDAIVPLMAAMLPEPSQSELELMRSYELNKARNNDRYLMRDDVELKAEWRMKYAKMIKRYEL